MWPFRRRRAGKHALGAAVTSIPSSNGGSVLRTPSVPSALPARPAGASAPHTPEVGAPALPVVEAHVVAHVAPLSVLAVGPRVELGFRDGSTASFPPGSDQAKALSDIASILAKRE